ncbi:MAG: type II toxin-antitoxin system HicA family toxin, partial [Hadesarchaea archaeon]|nr:type II toxin-antitoxin system HicA family toxin [Hadesarchaea archaeon]
MWCSGTSTQSCWRTAISSADKIKDPVFQADEIPQWVEISRIAVPPDKLIKILVREGLQTLRQNGSHVILAKEGVRIVVPAHPGKDIKPGLVRVIIREAKLTRKRFLELLEKRRKRLRNWMHDNQNG